MKIWLRRRFERMSTGVLIAGLALVLIMASTFLSVVTLIETGALHREVVRIETIHQGPPGKNGKDSTVPGPVGPSGVPGKDSTVPGPPGHNGTNGRDGVTKTIIVCELPTGRLC